MQRSLSPGHPEDAGSEEPIIVPHLLIQFNFTPRWSCARLTTARYQPAYFPPTFNLVCYQRHYFPPPCTRLAHRSFRTATLSQARFGYDPPGSKVEFGAYGRQLGVSLIICGETNSSRNGSCQRSNQSELSQFWPRIDLNRKKRG